MLAVAPSACGASTPPSPRLRSPWSTPATLTGCSSAWPAAVGYPASSPTAAAGTGAIVCAAGAGGLALAPLAGPLAAQPLSLTPGSPTPAGPFAVTTTGDGRIVVAASSVGGAGRGAILAQGIAGSSFGRPRRLGGPGSPLSVARAYLGDTAVASLVPEPHATAAIVVRLRRHFQRAFGRAIQLATTRGAVTALHVTLDYRSDALVTWQEHGSIWARVLRANGRLWPLRRVGASRPQPQLQALISDDNRAIVTWASATATRTHIWIDISGTDAVFDAAPKLVESYADAPGFKLPDGALRLVRMSTEGVLLAFTGKEAGRHVVRAAAVGLDGVKSVDTVSDPATDSVLGDLATGPRSDAIAAWVATAADGHREVVAARGSAPHAVAAFAAPESIAMLASPDRGVSVGVDPASDGAVAAWRDGGRIETARRGPG